MNLLSIDLLLELPNGHTGVLDLLTQLQQADNKAYADSILPTLTRLTSLRGTNLYFLWSEWCHKDMHTLAVLCEICPDHILANACSDWENSGYTLVEPYLLTRTSDIEKSIGQVVVPNALASALKGVWDQGTYSIYTDVFLDFSSGKNYYQYNTSFQGAKSIQKMEYKIDANNVMSYRNWNSDFDPAWKKYKVELVSPSSLKLYSIDVSGKASPQPQYMLIKRP